MSSRNSQAPYNRHISTSSSASLQGGFKLFGVRLSEPVPASLSSSSCSPFSAMRKSVSLGNLPSYDSPECGASQLEHAELETSLDGYVSDDLVHTASNARERKKGVPWTEEEHRRFLLGLQKLGKGDWRGISRNFVKTRTPTQVASHAQKYFLRRSNLNKRRRRSSLFDIIPELGDGDTEELTMETTDVCPLIHQLNLGQHGGFNKARVGEAEVMPGLGLPVGGFGGFQVTVTSIPRDEVMEEADVEDGHGTESAGRCTGNDDEDGGLPPFSSAPGIEVAGFGECGPNLNGESISFPFFRLLAWPNPSRPHPCADSKILKPTPVVAPATEESQRTPEPGPVMKPSPLSYKLLEDSSRQSAFHTMPSGNRSKVDTKESLSSAIRVA